LQERQGGRSISSQHLWELGNAYLQTRGANAELSRGMGFYFLELGIKMRLAEITPAYIENLAGAHTKTLSSHV